MTHIWFALLTYVKPMFRGVLKFSGGIEIDHWTEMG